MQMRSLAHINHDRRTYFKLVRRGEIRYTLIITATQYQKPPFKFYLKMAPGILETADVPQQLESSIKLSVFPDGLKTSGQHPPVYSQVRPYEDFPVVHTGPTVWKAEDYRENPELWTHRFSPEEIEEISSASDEFIQKGTPLTGISKV